MSRCLTCFTALLLLMLPLGLIGQEDLKAEPSASDAREWYLEDQFYLGLTYNLLLNAPDDIASNNLSYGVFTGFIKDIPINRQGTWAIGVGLGYGVNSYYSNLRAIQTADGIQYLNADLGGSFKRNKLETHLIEVPLELRWRNSTPEEYRFWRIYTGVKFGYIVGTRSKFVTSDFTDSFFNPDTENFQYGLTLSIGFNTFNLHAYYGLNSLFEDGVADPQGAPLEVAALRLGLVFYIL
ncbi:porin family protein [Robiginitalea sediminis]|uniref:porin family protein n=1 Tax=Robiginitalea sediminis TaxID=1982593 RepID=UPI000B4AAF0B|nr:porin family protein [Robiginitalea sediminis]